MLIKVTLTQEEIYSLINRFSEIYGDDTPFPNENEWDVYSQQELLDKVDDILNDIVFQITEKTGLINHLFYIESIENINIPDVVLNVRFEVLT